MKQAHTTTTQEDLKEERLLMEYILKARRFPKCFTYSDDRGFIICDDEQIDPRYFVQKPCGKWVAHGYGPYEINSDFETLYTRLNDGDM